MSIESRIDQLGLSSNIKKFAIEEHADLIIERAAQLEKEITTDSDLKQYFQKLRSRAKGISDPDTYRLSEAYKINIDTLSLVYLAAKRTVGESWKIMDNDYTWNITPRKVQVMAGTALSGVNIITKKDDSSSNNQKSYSNSANKDNSSDNQNHNNIGNSNYNLKDNRFILERTGEGKTAVSLFPIAYQSLFGKVHIMTANDYLAQRDHQWLGPVLNKLGINSAFLDVKEDAKFSAYDENTDVVFGSVKEFAFDYIKDSVKPTLDGNICKNRDYVLIDEADHIMLDEVKTPIILAAMTEEKDAMKQLAGDVVKKVLNKQEEYINQLKIQLDNILYQPAISDSTTPDSAAKNENKFQLSLAPLNKKTLMDIIKVKYSGIGQDWLNSTLAKNPSLESALNHYEHFTLNEQDFVKNIESELFFVVDKVQQTTFFTDNGIKYIEGQPGLADTFIVKDYEEEIDKIKYSDNTNYKKTLALNEFTKTYNTQLRFLSSINNALQAEVILKKDVDYIIKDGKIILVTPSTGRLDPVKKFQKGLSQAVEVKEGLEQTSEDIVLTQTMLPGLFNEYKKIGSMSGTILPNNVDFKQIYGFELFAIPTHRPPIAYQFKSDISRTGDQKIEKILRDIKFNYLLERPILIGTSSIESSEKLAQVLSEYDIPFNILNAKNESEEANIIAKAGHMGAITIATNMAGRGTDIAVDKDVNDNIIKNYISLIDHMKKRNRLINVAVYSQLEKDLLIEALNEHKEPFTIAQEKDRYIVRIDGALEEFSDSMNLDSKKPDSKKAYKKSSNKKNKNIQNIDFNLGLYVLGYELNDSQRINDQLRGRTGRQGQPGSSRFYVSLEDDILYHSQTARMFGRIATNDSRLVPNFIKRTAGQFAIALAQRDGEINTTHNIEETIFYCTVQEWQRILHQDFREYTLGGIEEPEIIKMIDNVIDHAAKKMENYSSSSLNDKIYNIQLSEDRCDKKTAMQEMAATSFKNYFNSIFNTNITGTAADIKPWDTENLVALAKKHALELYNDRKQYFKSDILKDQSDKFVQVLDSRWISQVELLEALKDSAAIATYGGKSKQAMYLKMADEAFKEYQQIIKEDLVREVFNIPLPHEYSVEFASNAKNTKITDQLSELLN